MNPDHVKVIRHGADAILEWRRINPHQTLDASDADLNYLQLKRADLQHADLSFARMHYSDLSGANLQYADLEGSDLRNVSLIGANVSQAMMIHANLFNADLSEANLENSLLLEASFYGTILAKTNFQNSTCGLNIFANIDLSECSGLDSILHYDPSTIGIDTLYLSKGKIPESFLRGCGVPQDLIDYLPSLLANAFQFYSCFISYSHKDEEFARRLYDRLQGAGIRVWFAPEEMKGGQKLHEQIFEGIRLHDKLLLVLSEHSMASEWVATEIRRTRRAEREQKKQKLFPISLMDDFDAIKNWECFDADSGKDIGVELREYFIPDFSNWKDHESFEKAFERLLKDLKGDPSRCSG